MAQCQQFQVHKMYHIKNFATFANNLTIFAVNFVTEEKAMLGQSVRSFRNR